MSKLLSSVVLKSKSSSEIVSREFLPWHASRSIYSFMRRINFSPDDNVELGEPSGDAGGSKVEVVVEIVVGLAARVSVEDNVELEEPPVDTGRSKAEVIVDLVARVGVEV